MQLKQIKTPDLARAIGMSIRNLRRYESGDLRFNFLTYSNGYDKLRDEFLYNAKVGLLVETLASPKINATLLVDNKCEKYENNPAPMQELKRLARVGQTVGAWYFNDEFKREMIK